MSAASKWFEGRQRRKIDPIGSSPIDWPADLAARHRVHRDWHTIAMRRARAAGISTEVLATFWRFVNLTEAPGTLWPSNDLIADIADISLKTVSRQVAAIEALGLIKTRRRWIDRNGNKQQVREIELTFPADLSRADFSGIAFDKSAWRRYLKGNEPKSDEAMYGPVTDDESGGSDEATHGPVSAECPSPSDRTMVIPTDEAMHGPGTVELTVEGEGSYEPSPIPSVTSTLSVGTDAHESASGQDDLLKVDDPVEIGTHGPCIIRAFGLIGRSRFIEATILDSKKVIFVPISDRGHLMVNDWMFEDEFKATYRDEMQWVDTIECRIPARPRSKSDAAA